MQPQTYEALKRVAAREGRELETALEEAVEQFLSFHGQDPDWEERFDRALERIRAGVPKDMSPEEIGAEVDAIIEEVRTEQRARSR